MIKLVRKILIFVAGGSDDPKPAGNELCQRYARCLTCNRIVHFSRTVKSWIYDDGTFHSGHLLEFPIEWITSTPPIQIKIEERRATH